MGGDPRGFDRGGCPHGEGDPLPPVAVCPAARPRRKRASARVSETKRKVSFGKTEVYFYPVEGEIFRHVTNKRNRYHRHEGLKPRDEAIADARRRALELAKELKYDSTSRSGKPAASALPLPGCDRHPRRWIADTGSGEDIIGPGEVPEASLQNPIECEEAAHLITANGPIKVDKRVALECFALGENVQPLLLPDTPAVVSVGRRVMDMLYEFHWVPYSRPYFVKPDGEVVWCSVEDYVPYLYDDAAATAGLAAKPEIMKKAPPASVQ